MQRSIQELYSEFDEKFPTLNGKIKELNDVTNELESMHKATTVGSLSGTVIGAATGIAAVVGVFLVPFTFGVSLAVAGVGAASAVTSTTCNITNMIKQKNLRQTIEKITDDIQNMLNPIIEHLKTISDIMEIQKKKWVSESDMTFPTTHYFICNIIKNDLKTTII
uniref:Apolipo L3-like protein n=1 Tax=Cyprinus carpio TaxID=7962 RepID=A0A8C1TMI4_CYPCA